MRPSTRLARVIPLLITTGLLAACAMGPRGGPGPVPRSESGEGEHEHQEIPKGYAGLENPVEPTAEALVAGQSLYDINCSACHGQDGDGRGHMAHMFEPPPADFTDKRMMSEVSDTYLYWRISEGIPGSGMPAFKVQLAPEERWQLVNYIRSAFAPGTQ